MNLIARRVIPIVIGLILVQLGIGKILITFAKHGGPLTNATREGLCAFAESIPAWESHLLALVLIALPVAQLVLWWRGWRSDRLLQAAPGLLIQESAVTGFLRGAVKEIGEVKSLDARCTMVKDKGLLVDCQVTLEARAQLADIQSRLKSAVRTCMAERLAVIPLAGVRMTVTRLDADRDTAQRATSQVAAATPAARPPIDLSPPDLDDEVEEETFESAPPPPISLDDITGEPPSAAAEKEPEGPSLP